MTEYFFFLQREFEDSQKKVKCRSEGCERIVISSRKYCYKCKKSKVASKSNYKLSSETSDYNFKQQQQQQQQQQDGNNFKDLFLDFEVQQQLSVFHEINQRSSEYTDSQDDDLSERDDLAFTKDNGESSFSVRKLLNIANDYKLIDHSIEIIPVCTDDMFNPLRTINNYLSHPSASHYNLRNQTTDNDNNQYHRQPLFSPFVGNKRFIYTT